MMPDFIGFGNILLARIQPLPIASTIPNSHQTKITKHRIAQYQT